MKSTSLLTSLVALSTISGATARSTIHDHDLNFDIDLDVDTPTQRRVVRSLPPQEIVFDSNNNARGFASHRGHSGDRLERITELNNGRRTQRKCHGRGKAAKKPVVKTTNEDRISYGGPGCPQSSIDLPSLGEIYTSPSLSKLSEDSTLYLHYPALNVSTSESVTFGRSQCSFTLNLESLGSAEEKHYSLKGLKTTVRYSLKGGATSTVSLTVFVPGEAEQRTFTRTLPPPSEDGASRKDDGEKEIVLWEDEMLTPCPRGDGLVVRASVLISGQASEETNSVTVVAFEPVFVWKDGSCDKDSDDSTRDSL